MKGYTKTTTLGDEDCIILAPQEAYQRETSLPANWRRARVGMSFSFAGLSGDNATPIGEYITQTTITDTVQMGFTNGVGFPTQAGNRFIGFGTNGITGISYQYSSWRPMTNANHQLSAWDGASWFGSSPHGGELIGQYIQNPTATSNFANYLILDMALGLDGRITLNTYISPSSVGITDVSTLALRTAMNYLPPSLAVSTSTGGWWNGADVGLRHFYVRFPYLSNRLRIHAVEVMQLA